MKAVIMNPSEGEVSRYTTMRSFSVIGVSGYWSRRNETAGPPGYQDVRLTNRLQYPVVKPSHVVMGLNDVCPAFMS